MLGVVIVGSWRICAHSIMVDNEDSQLFLIQYLGILAAVLFELSNSNIGFVAALWRKMALSIVRYPRSRPDAVLHEN